MNKNAKKLGLPQERNVRYTLSSETNLIILKALAEQLDGRLQSGPLSKHLETFGIIQTREWIEAALTFLDKEGAIVTSIQRDGGWVAALTYKGAQHVAGKIVIEGVALPAKEKPTPAASRELPSVCETAAENALFDADTAVEDFAYRVGILEWAWVTVDNYHGDIPEDQGNVRAFASFLLEDIADRAKALSERCHENRLLGSTRHRRGDAA